MAYKDLLLDPRWQRKRLEVLERENFTCQDCGATTKTLHVHHTYYAKGRKPWEYEAGDLRCLCAGCHEATGNELTELNRLVGALDEGQRAVARGYLTALIAIQSPVDVPITITEYAFSIGVAQAYLVGVDDVNDAAVNGVVMSETLIPIGQKRLAQMQVCDAIELVDRQPEGRPDGAHPHDQA